ncbi:MAG: lysine--tRNA ligase [Patescibacteria group bacterium]
MIKLSDEEKIRLEKLKTIRALGVDPYPAKSTRTRKIREVVEEFKELEKDGKKIILTGRLRSIRAHGALTFAHLEDESEKIQLALKRDEVGAKKYAFFGDLIDIGDFVEVRGGLFLTHKGEKTVLVKDFTLLSKSLTPLPEKWHGLTDTEIRFRKRYLDLISNPEVKLIFARRSAIVRAIREFFDARGFLEVETPILQPIPGGANARPFVTRHNALDIDMYLRIAPELYLKRLIVGGMERVYEIARCFRNEGIDHLHNPEFTQIEFYQAYADYEDLMKLTEELLPYLAKKVLGGTKCVYDKNEIDFAPPYPRITFSDAIKKYAKIDIEEYPTRDQLAKKAKALGVDVAKGDSHGRIMDELYKKFVRPNLIQPTFIINHPPELSPLAKKIPDSPKYVERFQLVLGGGIELCNAFSELNDPLEQEERFAEQEKARESGDIEAQRMDTDFLDALRAGMPPTAGFGMGIDRLTMILTNSHSVKEVILFPTLKPEK